MPALTFFTARLFYPAVVIDTAADAGGDIDVEPQIFGISATVTITPFIKHTGDSNTTASDIPAPTLTPTPALLALAPMRARLDNGNLKVTAEQTDIRLVAHTPVLGLPDGDILGYRFAFTNVTYAQRDQQLPTFCIAAPNTDTVINLASAPRITPT